MRARPVMSFHVAPIFGDAKVDSAGHLIFRLVWVLISLTVVPGSQKIDHGAEQRSRIRRRHKTSDMPQDARLLPNIPNERTAEFAAHSAGIRAGLSGRIISIFLDQWLSRL